jgi:hypothetical protein
MKTSLLRFLVTPLLAAGIALVAISGARAQSLVYSENFNNTTGVNQPIGSVGWSVIVGDGSSFIFTPNEASAGISGGNGRPGIANVGQADTSAATTQGFVFVGGAGPSWTHFLVTTSEYTGALPLNRDTLVSASFEQGNSANANASFRLALQIGDSWFVSPSQAGNNVGNAAAFVAGAVELTFNGFNTANWLTLNTETLTVGSTAMALPAGTVAAFGVFGTKADMGDAFTTARIDNFQVTAIPEPSTAVMLLGGLSLFLVLVRRRAHR